MAAVLRLISLKLRNFKGVREFHLDLLGRNAHVYGNNATGKTTLADAFTWLLFDKDSSNRKDFDIKTLDAEGRVLHNLEHEVEGTLAADDRQTTLRKVYKEVWTKKRGSATSEFTGHTTDYYVDGVPVQQSEYKTRVAAIADESTFRLMTDPRYFNEQLKWERRREILLAVCGNVSDQEVIASDSALAKLPDILGNRSLEDHRKVINARRRTINEELKALPVRINEATRGLPVVESSREALNTSIAQLTEKRQALQAEMARIDNGAQVVERRRQVSELDIDMLNLKQRLLQEAEQATVADRLSLADVREQADTKRREIRRLQTDGSETGRQIITLQTSRQKLLDAWEQIKAREFMLSVAESCPACGQDLPTGEVQAAREKALAEFNTKRSVDLEANKADGLRIRGQLDQLLAAQQQQAAAIEQAQTDLTRLEAEEQRLQEAIAQKRQAAPDLTQDATYRTMAQAKADLEQDIAILKAGGDEARQAVARDIADLDSQLNGLMGEVSKLDQRQAGLARIEDLKAQEQKLTAEYERLEQELYLCEQFTMAQATLLQERVNSRFQHATFKLFEKLINGGIEPCCETLYQGVPYSSALNTGARIVVGLDIINTLSEHYRFEAPIWIDNREAVTRLIPTRAQLISLVVSEDDERLRVQRELTPSERQAQLENEMLSALNKEAIA